MQLSKKAFFMRKYWLAILQGILSLALVWHLFSSPTLRVEAFKVVANAEPHWLVLGFITAILTESLCAVRWWCILRLFGTPVSLPRVFAFCGAGLFFSLGLPGSAGGDAFRILYVIRLYPRSKLRVSLTVLADRLCGLVALVVAFAMVTSFKYQLFEGDPHTKAILNAATMTLGSVVIMVSLWALFSIWRPSKKIWQPLEPIRKVGDRLGLVFPMLAGNPKLLAYAIFVSFPSLACHFTTYYFSMRSFNILIRLSEVFTVLPIVDTLILLPVTLFGIGLREALFEQLLGGLFGVSLGAATLASLGGFGLQAAVAILGGLMIPFTTPPATR
jgi:uncharacterized membrane protein YbhN (UPF0104 family)